MIPGSNCHKIFRKHDFYDRFVIGAAVNNLLGAKVSAVGGFFAGLVTGQSANTGI